MFNQNLLFVFVCLSYIYIRKTVFYILLGTLLLFSLSSSSSSKKNLQFSQFHFSIKIYFTSTFGPIENDFCDCHIKMSSRTERYYNSITKITWRLPTISQLKQQLRATLAPINFPFHLISLIYLNARYLLLCVLTFFIMLTWLSLGYDNKNNYINEIANFIPFSSDRLPFDPIWHCLSVRSANCNRHPTVAVDTMTIHHFEN